MSVDDFVHPLLVLLISPFLASLLLINRVTNSWEHRRFVLDSLFSRWGVSFMANWFWLKVGLSLFQFQQLVRPLRSR